MAAATHGWIEIDVGVSWAEVVVMNDGNERQQRELARRRVPKVDERGSRYAIGQRDAEIGCGCCDEVWE